MRYCFIYLIIFVLLTLNSCIKVNYKVQIDNRTKHNINKLVLSLKPEEVISLAPFQISDTIPISYTYSPLNIMGVGGLSVDVLMYDTVDLTNRNRTAPYWEITSLRRKHIEKIIISDCDSLNTCYNDYFSIKMENLY